MNSALEPKRQKSHKVTEKTFNYKVKWIKHAIRMLDEDLTPVAKCNVLRGIDKELDNLVRYYKTST